MSTDKILLNDQVHEALAQNPHLARRHVKFENHNGRVTLHGEVGTYYQKQVAQEVLRHVDGVFQITNELQVNWVS